MGLTDKSLEFQACVNLLEVLNPKQKEKLTQTIDLNSPVDSPNKETTEVMLIEIKDGKEDSVIKKEETTHEEQRRDREKKAAVNYKTQAVP